MMSLAKHGHEQSKRIFHRCLDKQSKRVHPYSFYLCFSYIDGILRDYKPDEIFGKPFISTSNFPAYLSSSMLKSKLRSNSTLVVYEPR